MTPQQFVFFLKGILDAKEHSALHVELTKVIKVTLDGVFEHVAAVSPNKKPTLQELLPNISVHSTDPSKHPKPNDWKPDWWLDSMHGWTPPGEKYRC